MKAYLVLILAITINCLQVYPDECELTIEPSGWEDCKGKETDTKAEVCCFIRGKRAYTHQNRKTWCADVERADIDTPEKMENTKKRIIDGTYWEDVNETFSLEEIICYESNIKFSFLLLVLFLLF